MTVSAMGHARQSNVELAAQVMGEPRRPCARLALNRLVKLTNVLIAPALRRQTGDCRLELDTHLKRIDHRIELGRCGHEETTVRAELHQFVVDQSV